MRKKNTLSYYGLLTITFVIVLFGIIMISTASSTIAFAREKDVFFYMKKQILWVFFGFIGLFFFSRLDFRKLKKVSFIFAGISFLLLVLVLIAGKLAGGAKRWLIIGGFSFQPSEFTKFSMIILGADLLSRVSRGKLSEAVNYKRQRFFLIFITAINGTLILLQPDFGTAILIVIAVFLLMVLAGDKFTDLFKISTFSLPIILFLAFFEKYRLARIISFLSPDKDLLGSGFHLNQSLIAFGSGGLYGKGIGMSRQKFFYLPAAHTDFIFAI
jgi:cell division protein FtsW